MPDDGDFFVIRILKDGWEQFTTLFATGKVFLIVGFVEALVLMLVQIAMFVDNVERCVQSPCRDETNNFYSVSIWIMGAFFAYFAIHGLLSENMFEIFAFLVTTFLMLCYSMILITGNSSWHFVTQFAVTLVCQIIYLFLAYKIYLEIGWHIYKRIGANSLMRKMYRISQLFLTLCKLDLLFALIITILAGLYFFDPSQLEFYVTVVAFCVAFAWAWLGYRAVWTEDEVLMNVFFGLALFQPMFVFYKYVRVNTSNGEQFPASLFAMTASAAAVVRIALMITAVKAKNNFGKGLVKEVYIAPPGRKSRPLQSMAEDPGTSAAPTPAAKV